MTKLTKQSEDNITQYIYETFRSHILKLDFYPQGLAFTYKTILCHEDPNWIIKTHNKMYGKYDIKTRGKVYILRRWWENNKGHCTYFESIGQNIFYGTPENKSPFINLSNGYTDDNNKLYSLQYESTNKSYIQWLLKR